MLNRLRRQDFTAPKVDPFEQRQSQRPKPQPDDDGCSGCNQAEPPWEVPGIDLPHAHCPVRRTIRIVIPSWESLAADFYTTNIRWTRRYNGQTKGAIAMKFSTSLVLPCLFLGLAIGAGGALAASSSSSSFSFSSSGGSSSAFAGASGSASSSTSTSGSNSQSGSNAHASSSGGGSTHVRCNDVVKSDTFSSMCND